MEKCMLYIVVLLTICAPKLHAISCYPNSCCEIKIGDVLVKGNSDFAMMVGEEQVMLVSSQVKFSKWFDPSSRLRVFRYDPSALARYAAVSWLIRHAEQEKFTREFVYQAYYYGSSVKLYNINNIIMPEFSLRYIHNPKQF